MCKGHKAASHNQSALVLDFPPVVNSSFLEFKRQCCTGLLRYPLEIHHPCLKDCFLLGLCQSFSRPVVGEPRGRPRVEWGGQSAHDVSFLQADGWHCEGMAPLMTTPCHSAFFLGSNIKFFSNISPWTHHDKSLDSYCTNSCTQKRAQGC